MFAEEGLRKRERARGERGERGEREERERGG